MNESNFEAMAKYASIGPDFLTWLFYRVANDIACGSPSEPGLLIDVQGPLVFVSDGAEAPKITLTGDEAGTAPEALHLLRKGRRLASAKLVLTAQEDSWTFTLDASTFDLKSIRLPVPAIPDRDQYLIMRAQSTMRLLQLLDEQLEIFLPVRLDPRAWAADVKLYRAA